MDNSYFSSRYLRRTNLFKGKEIVVNKNIRNRRIKVIYTKENCLIKWIIYIGFYTNYRRYVRLAYRFSGSAAFFEKSPIVVNNREKCGLNDKTLITTRNKTRNPSTFSERKNVEENKIRIFVVASVHTHYAHLVEAFRPTILEPCQRKNSRNNWNKIARKKTRSLRFASYLLFERLLKRFLSQVISYLLIQREKEDGAER